jgi:GNAT superfamily N-acetyltransferase
VRFRPVSVEDAGILAANVIAGMETYRSFAGEGWEPVAAEDEQAGIRARLQSGAWGRLAVDEGRVAGHVLVVPADGVPGCAHLAGLFVGEPWWGTGLAARLLALAVAEMRAQGYALARLYTPELQARARRFYEREGWELQSGVVRHPELGLDLVEYRRALRAGAGRR